MLEQKKFLEDNGWSCSLCGCRGAKGYDCVNDKFKGYTITLKTTGVSRVMLNGRAIISTASVNLISKMRQNNLV